MSHGRPVHIFYLSDKWIDSECQDFLQRIGGLTQGSAHLIRLNNSGDIKQVIPIYATDLTTSGPLYSDLKIWALLARPAFIAHPYLLREQFRVNHIIVGLESRALIKGDQKANAPHCYPVILAEKVGKGLFLVEFDKSTKDPREKWQVSVQKTALHDIILYNEAMRHSVLSGDKVLAPWEPDETRYGPGTVAFGIETRDPLQ
eukprot:g48205.t1